MTDKVKKLVLLHIGQGFSAAFASLAPSFHLLDLCVGAAGAVLIRLAVYSKGKNAKKYRRGIEYGSARWGTPADIAPYVDPDFSQNVLLTQTERITMSSRPKEPKYARNKNILVIGGSGSGKTRFFVKPNLLQCHSSYVVTDPKGTILNEVGALLDRKGYRIKSLNLINFKKSMRYNPLAYIRSEKDILKLVNALILNTKGEGEKSSEDFWVKAERLYYSALIGYIWYEAEPEERNFITLLDLINASEAREDDEEFQSPVDLLFAKLEKEHPDHFAVKQYRKFKMAAGKTLKSILISCGARLSAFLPLTSRSCGTSWRRTSWSWIPWATANRRCSSSSRIRTALSILWRRSCTLSFSICCATRRTTSTAAACRSMCGVCWMSLRISGKSRTSTS